MGSGALSRVVTGKVMHRRRHPVDNHFVYPVFFLLLRLDELKDDTSLLFGVNRKRPVSFNFRDYGDGRDPEIWVRELLQEHGVNDCGGPIWVQTFPRLLGYLFNPVSFWYCTRPDATVGAIVAEVNNTFGDKHYYLLTPNPDLDGFSGLRAAKRLYVSPFYPVEGEYRFDFNTDFDSPRVKIDYFKDGKLQLNTAIHGASRPLSTSSLAAAAIRQPFLTLGVIAKIHWQALRLWLKGVRLHKRPTSTLEETAK